MHGQNAFVWHFGDTNAARASRRSIRPTSSAGRYRTSVAMMGTTTQPRSRSAAVRLRSRRNASGPLCQSTPSYSAATRLSGQAKSSRQVRPLRSTTSYCSTGGGSPPSSMTNRASLSIGDSASGEAKLSNSRTVTMPRRPDCRSITGCRSPRLHVPLRSAASSVASARGRRSPRATSIAVQAGAVAGRPVTPPVIKAIGAPSRRCTNRPAAECNRRPTGLSTCKSVCCSVSKPYIAAAVARQAATVVPVARSSPRSRSAIVNAPWPYIPCQIRCSAPLFTSDSRPRRVKHVSAWAEVTTPPCWSSSRQSSAFTPHMVGHPRMAHNSPWRAAAKCRPMGVLAYI